MSSANKGVPVAEMQRQLSQKSQCRLPTFFKSITCQLKKYILAL
jgi:hypothetical protein